MFDRALETLNIHCGNMKPLPVSPRMSAFQSVLEAWKTVLYLIHLIHVNVSLVNGDHLQK